MRVAVAVEPVQATRRAATLGRLAHGDERAVVGLARPRVAAVGRDPRRARPVGRGDVDVAVLGVGEAAAARARRRARRAPGAQRERSSPRVTPIVDRSTRRGAARTRERSRRLPPAAPGTSCGSRPHARTGAQAVAQRTSTCTAPPRTRGVPISGVSRSSVTVPSQPNGHATVWPGSSRGQRSNARCAAEARDRHADPPVAEALRRQREGHVDRRLTERRHVLATRPRAAGRPTCSSARTAARTRCRAPRRSTAGTRGRAPTEAIVPPPVAAAACGTHVPDVP